MRVPPDCDPGLSFGNRKISAEMLIFFGIDNFINLIYNHASLSSLTTNKKEAVMNGKEELYVRLCKKRDQIRTIKISWNASDGGPRMNVELFDTNAVILDEWNDWMILGNTQTTGVKIIIGIVQTVFSDKITIRDSGNMFINFTVG
jgi:hypothetical protein